MRPGARRAARDEPSLARRRSRPNEARRHREARADADRARPGSSAWSKPRTRRRSGWVGTGTSAAGGASSPAGAPATIWAAIASATPRAAAELQRVHERPRGALEGDRRPRPRQRGARRRAAPAAGRGQPAARAALAAQEAQLRPGRASTAAGRPPRSRRSPSTLVGASAEPRAASRLAGGGEHPPMLARGASRLYRAIATILRSGCGRFVDVRPRRRRARGSGRGGVRTALAPRAGQARPARRARRPPGRLHCGPARPHRGAHLAHRPARRAVLRHAHGPAHPAAGRRADPAHRQPDEGHPAPGHPAPAASGTLGRPARAPGRGGRPLRRRHVGSGTSRRSTTPRCATRSCTPWSTRSS